MIMLASAMLMLSTRVESWSLSPRIARLSYLKRPLLKNKLSQTPRPFFHQRHAATSASSSETLRYDPNEEKWGPGMSNLFVFHIFFLQGL